MGGRGPTGILRLAPLALVGALLAGCGGVASYSGGWPGSQAQPAMGRYKVGAPYQINGVWYYPRVDYNYDQSGIASWYGEQFDQKYTANGEIFDLNQLTAAHRTLPLPSIVEVTNLDNGRLLRLRVNDRGPYADGRIIDVSRRAAQLLGFETAGTAHVRVRILRDESIRVAELAQHNVIDNGAFVAEAMNQAAVAQPAPRVASAPPAEPAPPLQPAATPVVPPSPAVSSAPLPPPAAMPSAPPPVATQPPPPSARRNIASYLIAPAEAATLPPLPRPKPPGAPSAGHFFIQAGAFARAENAQHVRARIAVLGSVEVSASAVKGVPLYRVRLGPVRSHEEADRLLIQIIGSGYPGARIVAD
jgi:rare lipoprotein A